MLRYPGGIVIFSTLSVQRDDLTPARSTVLHFSKKKKSLKVQTNSPLLTLSINCDCVSVDYWGDMFAEKEKTQVRDCHRSFVTYSIDFP